MVLHPFYSYCYYTHDDLNHVYQAYTAVLYLYGYCYMHLGYDFSGLFDLGFFIGFIV